MCHARGVNFDWDFDRYCQAAHYEAHALRDHLYTHFPQLQRQEPSWDVLYAEKKQAISELFAADQIQLMPGVPRLLTALQVANIPRCVVTHSPDQLVQLARQQNPILDTIPIWFTREHYSQPKPHPECYIKAIEQLAKPSDRVIGFEDTPRGVRALQGTRAQVVLVCQAQYPEIPTFVKAGVRHYSSFEEIHTRL